MYQEHPRLQAPDENDLLWRYIDLTKLVSLLAKKALFFSAPRVFGDPFEGHFPKEVYDRTRTIENPAIRTHNLNFLRWSAELNQEQHCVSCWHRASHQSAAMWKLYSHTKEGIAITTTYGNLKNSFSSNHISVSGGLVKYIDFEKETFEGLNLLVALTLKRKSFEHEKEFRAIIMGETIKDQKFKGNNGYYIPVDIDVLIKDIYISPSARPDFKDVVISLLEKYSCIKTVRQSNLENGPEYIS